jgi:hypothetical protein
MSELHPSDRKALLRAGFTEREIATQQRKFCNLTQINPCYTDELKQFEQLQADRRVLLEALKDLQAAIKSRGVISTVKALSKADAAIIKAEGGAA